MTTYVYRDGELLDKEQARPLYEVIAVSDLPSPSLIRDEMAPTRHMVDAKMYTSKRKFREATKAAGCIELGNDPSLYNPRKKIPLDRDKRRRDIKSAIDQLQTGKKGRQR